MRLPTLFALACGTLLAASAPLQAQVAVGNQRLRSAQPLGAVAAWQGLAGGEGQVSWYNAQTGHLVASPPTLSQLRLLNIDVVGRTVDQTWDPSQVRLREDVPGGRLVLPDGRGTLLRYVRRIGGSTFRFGILHLQRSGAFRRLAERSGWGPAGTADPYLDFVAVGPTAENILLATVPQAGGDLVAVDLQTAGTSVLTSAQPPLSFSPASFGLSSTWGYGVASDRIVRFDLAPGSAAQVVPIAGGPPGLFSGESAWSPGRTRVVTTGGPGSTMQIPYVFGRQGSAAPRSSTPANLVGAGYLPASRSGPLLAVDDAGECAAWVVQEAATRELYASDVSQTTAQHLSGDAEFADTFGETGVISVQVPGSLQFAVGERDDLLLGGLEGADFYSATAQPGGGFSIVNVTKTSGDLVAPFEGDPSITPQEMLATAGGLLVYDDDEGRLIAIQGNSATTLMNDLKDHDFFMPVPGGILAGLRRDSTNAHGVWWVDDSLASTPIQVDSSSPGSERLNPVKLEGSRIGYLLGINEAPSLVGVLDHSTGVSVIAATGTAPYGLAMAATPAGGLAFVRQDPAGFDLSVAWGAPGPLTPFATQGQSVILLPVE